MQNIFDGIVKAFQLLIQGDPEVIQITLLSLAVSGLATLISLMIGLPLGTFLAQSHFATRRFWISLVNTGMALPPVVVGF
jgi:tungstate transport system permease protein